MSNLDALLEWLAANYDLAAPMECRLLRAYTNDVYEVRSADARYVLKVYGKDWRSADEIRYEVALLRHLAARDLPIASPIPGKDTACVKTIATIDGVIQYAVLFAYASGEKPQPPFSPALYAAFGRAIARMHALSLDFATEYTRRPLDLIYLIDAPIAGVLPLLKDPADHEFLKELAESVSQEIAAFVEAGLEWGPIHGDATLDNLHVTSAGEVILFDFDSGGPGWRASDLQGWTVISDEFAERGAAFRSGYAEIGTLDPVNWEAAPALTLAWDIWGLNVDLERRILPQGNEMVQAFLRERIELLKERERLLRQL